MNTLFIRLKFIPLLIALLVFGRLYAQPTFPPTAGLTCFDCVPDGYSKVDPTYQPAISYRAYYGLDNGNWENGPLPAPPSDYSNKLGSTHHNFVSLRSSNTGQGKVEEAISTTVNGFIMGREYTFVYSVLASRLPAPTNVYGKSIKLNIKTPGQCPFQCPALVKEDETIFGQPSTPNNTWITKSITFTASASTLVFTFSAGAVDFGQIGFVNLDVNNYPFPCASTVNGDVPVTSTDVNILCPSATFDLNTLVTIPPAGVENKWYTTAGHVAGTEVDQPGVAGPGTYYVFQYNPAYACYNQQYTTQNIVVHDNPQVTLTADAVSNACPETKVTLGNYVQLPLPANHVVRWFTNANHSGPALDPLIAGSQSDTYYPFLFNTTSQCYSTATATDSLTVTINAPCCQSGTAQVALKSNNKVLGCGETFDLNSYIASNFTIPAGTQVVWYTDAHHTAGTLVINPSAVVVGTYYGFVYDAAAKCFNTDDSNAKITVSGINGFQVPLDTDTLINICPSKSVNLYSAYSGTPPPGFELVFYSTPNHANGTGIFNGGNLFLPGTYYAFFFDQISGCFNTDNSTASIKVIIVDCTPCPATGSNQVTLNKTQLSNICPATTVNLNSTIGAIIPGGLEVVWYDNAFRMGAKVPNPTSVAASGTYYAFLHDINGDCYNTGWSTAKVDVTITSPCPPVCNAGLGQVAINDNTLSNTCPIGFVSINSVLVGAPPANTEYKWFTDPNHTAGNEVADPNHVSVSGDYYAFIFDAVNNCYNTDNSTAKVNVLINECKVFTQIKVKLQGAMDGNSSNMHTNLHQSGLMPLTDPYGTGATWPAFPLVVDWIKVEIRSAADPSVVLDDYIGLLEPDGDIIGVNGNAYPNFAPQSGPVQIVVKHRNHLPIISTVIQSFSTGTVLYDFTDADWKAYNDGSAPAQMVLVNGAWCMPAGDLNGNNALTNEDRDLMMDAFHLGLMDQYVEEDLNMDGAVDDVDVSYFNANFYKGLYSILTKF